MSATDQLLYLAVEQLQRGRFQPRRDFEPEALTELTQSIRTHGIIEPIIVRRAKKNHYEIIAGERRWRAAQLAQLATVPCIVRDYSDAQAAEVALIENVQRANLNPIEEAQALSRLIADFDYTQAKLAEIIGHSRTKITNSLRLLSLDRRIQQWLIEKKMTEGHGKILAGLPSAEQIQFASICIEKAWSVHRLENEIKKTKQLEKRICEKNKKINITYLAAKIAEYFNTEVILDGEKSGWVKIKYYNNETLVGILNKMGILEE